MVTNGGRARLREWAVSAGVFAAAALLLAWMTEREVRSSERDAELLMRAQARSIADLVGESGLHGLEMYRHWEDEVAARLLDNAHWLSRLDAERSLTSDDLAVLAKRHALGRINLFDARGEKAASSVVEADEGLAPRHDPRDFIGPILRGEVSELRIGFKPARYRGGSRFAVAVARRGGGAVVVNVFADSMRMILGSVRPQHLLATLGRADGVRYVVLQRGDSVLASTPVNARDVPPPLAPSLLATTDSSTLVCERPTSLGRVYEVTRNVRPTLDDGFRLRIGLDAAPLDRARNDVKRRAWVRGVLLLLVGFLGMVFLMQRERQRWLSAEVEVIRDELEKRDRETRRNARLVAMGELAAHVAHEIRNPLNTIHLTAQQLVRDPKLAPEFHLPAEDIRIESRRIEGIIQQFLEFACPRKPQPRELDLLDLVRQAARTAKPLFAQAGIRLMVEGESSTIWQDPDLLGEILGNLLRNACEASPRGSTVTVAADHSDDEVYITVSDMGPGVSIELRERVFDPYYSSKPNGTGLGLSIVAQLSSALGGAVWVEASPPPGARFVLRLPARLVEA